MRESCTFEAMLTTKERRVCLRVLVLTMDRAPLLEIRKKSRAAFAFGAAQHAQRQRLTRSSGQLSSRKTRGGEGSAKLKTPETFVGQQQVQRLKEPPKNANWVAANRTRQAP